MPGGTTSEPGRSGSNRGLGRGWLARRSIILVAAAVPAALFPLVMLGVLTINRASEVVDSEVRKRLQLTTSLSGELISEHIEAWARLTESAASRPGLVAAAGDGNPDNFDLETIDVHLSNLMAMHPGLSGMAVVDLDGVIHSAPNSPELIGLDLTFRDYYQALRASGETQISEALESAQVGQPLIVIFATYIRGVDGTGTHREPAAILVKALFLDQIQGFSDEVARGGGVRLWVADAKGTVVATPDGGPTDLTHISDLPIGAIEGDDVVAEIEVGDETLLITRYAIDDLGWQTFAAIPLAEARAGPISIRTRVLAVGIPLMLVVCIGIWLLVRYQRHEWLLALELEQERDRADEANLQKSAFLSRMSHELRTPLNAVLGFAQVLEMDDLTQAQHDAVSQVLKGGRHLLGLVNEVLDISRVESGTLALSIEPVPVDQLVRETVDLVRGLAADRSIEILVAGSSVMVQADRQRLKQVLLNLLSNAIKYNHDAGTVTVETVDASPGRTRVVVSDTGPGLDPEAAAQVFVPFDRLGAEKTGIEGTGIGLALSNGLAQAMGGNLGLESEPGLGSRFWIELPTAEAAATPPAEATTRVKPELAQRPATARILYVDDNIANLNLVERILERQGGLELISVMQGGLAVEMAREHQPALILLDVHLPDLSGEEVLARLKADPETRAIPVVVVSADASQGRLERFLAAGAAAYSTKPIDIPRFLEILDEFLAC